MDVFTVMLIVIVTYGVLYFFDNFFKSCAHYPYIQFLKGTGLEFKFLQIKWKTTAFNRLIIRWGVNSLRFFEIWFNVGVYASLALLPIAIVLLLVSLFEDIFPPVAKKIPTLEPIIPYVNLPASETVYFSISILLNSIIHELGHALASVTEDVHVDYFGANVFLIFPVAYVSLNTENLFSLNSFKILKVLCAGIWHNIVLTFSCYIVYLILPTIFSLFFVTDQGIFIKELALKSSLAGEKGFTVGDVIVKINDCKIYNEHSWYSCLTRSQTLVPSFCLESDLIHELEESVPVNLDHGIADCCGKNKPKNLCFEYLDNNNGVLEIPQYACLPARNVITSSANYCSTLPHLCSENTYCFRPLLQNTTNLFKVERLSKPDVIYIGHASDLSRFISISPYVPKLLFSSSAFPDVLTKVVGYICVFSLGLGIINILPCAYMDGQYILNALVPLVLRNSATEETTKMISCVITIITTVMLTAHILYIVVIKLSFI